jgi:hypothetical protein
MREKGPNSYFRRSARSSECACHRSGLIPIDPVRRCEVPGQSHSSESLGQGEFVPKKLTSNLLDIHCSWTRIQNDCSVMVVPFGTDGRVLQLLAYDRPALLRLASRGTQRESGIAALPELLFTVYRDGRRRIARDTTSNSSSFRVE